MNDQQQAILYSFMIMTGIFLMIIGLKLSHSLMTTAGVIEVALGLFLINGGSHDDP